MRNYLILAVLFTLAACTSQVETNLPEPETLNVTTDDEREVVLRSTEQECNDYQEDSLSMPATAEEYEHLLECRLNQGVNETEVLNSCDFSEQYSFVECIYTNDILNNYSQVVSRLKNEVVENTDDCTPSCASASATTGCRTIIFTITDSNDEQCPGAPDEYEVWITADVYCCE